MICLMCEKNLNAEIYLNEKVQFDFNNFKKYELCKDHENDIKDYQAQENFAIKKQLKENKIKSFKKDFPKIFQDVDISNLLELHRNKCLDFINNPDSWCLFLQGKVGTGKTYICLSAVNEWRKNYGMESTAVYNSMDLVMKLQDDYKNNNNKNYNFLSTCDLLAIDDLGTERSTEDAVYQIMRVIFHRYNENLKTIITTNESIDSLASKFHPRLTSRFMSGVPIVLKGNDRRMAKL